MRKPSKEGYYIVDGKTKNILEENWDFLIILDAARYDFFKKLYKNYLSGCLKRAISPATNTMEWFNRVFPSFYDDIVYVSANPYVNSKIEVTDRYGLKFDGKKHFYKIIDVWDWGWSSRTVHPSKMKEAIIMVKNKYKKKRFILHYIQPHIPYISENYIHYRSKSENVIRIPKIRRFIKKLIKRTFGIEGFFGICNLLGITPVSQYHLVGMKEGIKGLRKAYKENLELVLEHVAKLLENLSGNILIISDHGEYLGEYGRCGHGIVPRHPPIIEVPWLIINL